MVKKTRKGQEQSHRPLVKVTWAEMIRDVMVIAINRGQGPIYFLGFILAVFIFKMPSEKVGNLADELINGLKSGWLVGYILAIALLILLYVSSRRHRSISFREQDRMGKEKAKLQKKILGDALKSSRN